MSSESKTSLYPFDRAWCVEDAVPLAVLLEASSPKAGNVHPGSGFADMGYAHFLASAVAIRPMVSPAALRGMQNQGSDAVSCESVGSFVLSAVRRTRSRVGCNTNLGTLLLFGPIIMGALRQNDDESLCDAVGHTLADLSSRDSHLVYQAIRLAQPGGLGETEDNDVAGDAPDDLVAAMQQAASVDAVARQYTNNFADVFKQLLPGLNTALAKTTDVRDAICRLQIELLAKHHDGLIVRKCGSDVAEEVRRRAEGVWRASESTKELLFDQPEFQLFDDYLRSEDHRLNPGTTADLIAATLLVRLLQG